MNKNKSEKKKKVFLESLPNALLYIGYMTSKLNNDGNKCHRQKLLTIL